MKRVAFTLLALLFVGGACKKTVEGESKRFAQNKQNVLQMAALYPGFAAPLKARVEEADRAMTAAAAGAADEQPQLMAAVNAKLMGGFVGQLKEVDGKLCKLREKSVAATTAIRDIADSLGARQAIEAAESVAAKSEELLRAGAPDETAAAAIVAKIVADLDSAAGSLDGVIAASQKKQEATAAAAAGAAGAAGAAQAPAAAPAPANWKCEYCGNENTGDLTKCGSCGAAKP